MFRHSEIQAIIRKRRQKRDNEDASEDGEITPDFTVKDTASLSVSTVVSGTAPAETDRVTSGRVEKPTGQQWAKTSTRTQTRNKKNRNKYKLKKRTDRDKREQKRNNRQSGDEGSESDEWDPWHQANGPDVQKDDTVALDY